MLFYYGINIAEKKKSDALAQHMFHWEPDKYVGLKVNKLYILSDSLKRVNSFRPLAARHPVPCWLESMASKTIRFLPKIGSGTEKGKFRLHAAFLRQVFI